MPTKHPISEHLVNCLAWAVFLSGVVSLTVDLVLNFVQDILTFYNVASVVTLAVIFLLTVCQDVALDWKDIIGYLLDLKKYAGIAPTKAHLLRALLMWLWMIGTVIYIIFDSVFFDVDVYNHQRDAAYQRLLMGSAQNATTDNGNSTTLSPHELQKKLVIHTYVSISAAFLALIIGFALYVSGKNYLCHRRDRGQYSRTLESMGHVLNKVMFTKCVYLECILAVYVYWHPLVVSQHWFIAMSWHFFLGNSILKGIWKTARLAVKFNIIMCYHRKPEDEENHWAYYCMHFWNRVISMAMCILIIYESRLISMRVVFGSEVFDMTAFELVENTTACILAAYLLIFLPFGAVTRVLDGIKACGKTRKFNPIGVGIQFK
ncbi:hypothetical protein Ddc_14122 [Ditylenchus destructor]|nr:hypothetical protein Ddc_14122 [Ditylenchus destructor]